ncbi:hypothetical protein IQ259_09545 [Fortiea sp. LEGE XX443]|uniref:hypothetical protein n=1 Tax=Fortiea sp. LEGE XX443 TaxID=1828611 RepID=UPI00187F7702|nr:hypothetical protein [Fortiea sp. LEGE XX443]MBE9005279.1 hypothetical protein [Fortiea sp. LEGE XX443]
MIKKINNSHNVPSLTNQVELELLEVLLQPEDSAYPWNPADDQAEAYFDELEQQFVKQDLLEDELHIRAQSFYEKLDTLWSEVASCSDYKCNTRVGIFESLCETLHNTFAVGVPTGWLNAIAQKATEVVAAQQSIGEQLVECVQTVLPTWGAEDLAVFSRPYVYTMRSSEPQNLTSIIKKIENRDWTTLSEIEQAKVSVAIAYYALRQLDKLETEA